MGKPVLATAAGELHHNAYKAKSNPVVIDHDPADGSYTRGFATLYLHMSLENMRPEGPVKAGDIIGYVSDVGAPGAYHLHYEQRENWTVVKSKFSNFTPTYRLGGTDYLPNTSCPDTRTDVVIRSLGNNKYVSAELDYRDQDANMLRARASSVGGWEQFTIVGDCTSVVGCAIQSKANGQYVTAELNYRGYAYGELRARASAASAWERFGTVGDCRSASGCALQSKANGKYVSAELSYTNAGYAMLRARASSAAGWEKFYIGPQPAAAPKPAPVPQSSGDTLAAGSRLTRGMSLRSTDGVYALTFQTDGNLVLTRNGSPLWATYAFSAERYEMQGDGNFVGYDANGRWVWQSGTGGSSGTRITVQTDGNLVVYNGNTAKWYTNTYGGANRLQSPAGIRIR